MSVYVDELRPCTPTRGWRYHQSAHLLADTPDELHAFAKRLGLRRDWYQPGSTPHYDLTAKRQRKAIELGAELLDRPQIVALIRRLREDCSAWGRTMENVRR